MPHKLLLADDSVTIQRVIELTFADEDIQVVAVSDGDQAIAQLDANPPDIVLADVGMPGRDGYEVAAYVKQSPRLAHIPVLLLTGAFEPVDQARASAAGCDGVLAKPFEPQLVIGRVKELLAAQGKAAPLPPAPAPEPEPPATEWPAQPAPAAAPPAASNAGDAPGLDNYFDRLDQAFATLSGGQAPAAKPQPPAPSALAESLDWFAPSPNPPAADLPLSLGSLHQGFDQAPASSARVEPAPQPTRAAAAAQAAAASPSARAALPALADAFAALLAAEQSAPAPAEAPSWPTPPSASVSDDLVEQVTHRVLDRLTDRVVRDTVADRVSAIAERLVREEIARIKSSIK